MNDGSINTTNGYSTSQSSSSIDQEYYTPPTSEVFTGRPCLAPLSVRWLVTLTSHEESSITAGQPSLHLRTDRMTQIA